MNHILNAFKEGWSRGAPRVLDLKEFADKLEEGRTSAGSLPTYDASLQEGTDTLPVHTTLTGLPIAVCHLL